MTEQSVDGWVGIDCRTVGAEEHAKPLYDVRLVSRKPADARNNEIPTLLRVRAIDHNESTDQNGTRAGKHFHATATSDRFLSKTRETFRLASTVCVPKFECQRTIGFFVVVYGGKPANTSSLQYDYR